MNQVTDAASIERSLSRLASRKWSLGELAEVIDAFGNSMGVEGLTLNEHGTVWITVDEATEICLFHLPHMPGLVAAAPMAIETRDDPRVLRALLQANMSWQRTLGGCFAKASISDEPMLCRLIPLETMDHQVLDREIARFVDLVQVWHHEIERLVEQNEADEQPKMLSPSGMRV